MIVSGGERGLQVDERWGRKSEDSVTTWVEGTVWSRQILFSEIEPGRRLVSDR